MYNKEKSEKEIIVCLIKVFFGELFDFNGDGRLDAFERAADMSAFVNLMDEEDDDLEAEDSEDEDTEA